MNGNERENVSYLNFLDMVAECVTAAYNGRVRTEKSTSEKNNGVFITGLLLKMEGDRVAPNFYLEEQYLDWKHRKKELYDIVSWLCRTYEEERKKNHDLAERIVMEWEEFQKSVFVRLVNRQKNEEILKKLPYEEFMDLAVVYYFSIELAEGMYGTILLTMEHLKLLGITQEELHETAMRNTRNHHQVKLCQMDELILTMGKRIGIPLHELKKSLSEKQSDMYVLSNQTGMFGAAGMIYDEVLSEMAKKLGGSFYVLPSSIHELILVPGQEGLSPEKFADIVREVNATHVDATEQLSDSVYYFDCEVGKLKRVG